MDEQSYILMQLDLQHAIEEVIRKHEGAALVTKWVACVETVDAPTGAPGLWTLSNPGAKAWDSMGMLKYYLAREEAKLMAGMPFMGVIVQREDDEGVEG